MRWRRRVVHPRVPAAVGRAARRVLPRGSEERLGGRGGGLRGGGIRPGPGTKAVARDGRYRNLPVKPRQGFVFPGVGRYCRDLSVCANVLAPLEFASVVSLGGLMTRLVAVIFFAMLTGNAMAQAGGASSGPSGAGALGTTASTV